MDVIDFVSSQKELYKPGAEPTIVEVPDMLFLVVDGKGQPDEGGDDDANEFQQAFGALYGVAYSIKMSERKGQAPAGYQNFKVPPPEGLWWMDDGSEFDMAKPDLWRWRVMLRMPEFVTQQMVDGYADELVIKKKSDTYKKVRVERYHEGLCVQLMHIGPYADEGPNIEKLHAYARDLGYKLHGKHHEIYFGDPRRTAPEKLKTILRQPVTK